MTKSSEFMTSGKAGRVKRLARSTKPAASKVDHPVDLVRRFQAVMSAAARAGLIGEKTARIGGRVSPELVRQAKVQTGIEADTDLIAFALANLALEDNFAAAFKAARGKLDPDLPLGF